MQWITLGILVLGLANVALAQEGQQMQETGQEVGQETGQEAKIHEITARQFLRGGVMEMGNEVPMQVLGKDTPFLQRRQIATNVRDYGAAIEVPGTVTALCVQIKGGEGLVMENVKVLVNGVFTPLQQNDELAPRSDGWIDSHLVIFDKPVGGVLVFIDGPVDTPVRLDFINGAAPEALGRKAKAWQQRQAQLRTEEEYPCSGLPDAMPQAIWREGLPAPNYSRSFTPVKHLVVHHSAGSNTASNYLEVVRSIYIFHTQSRGWSDVGYNYLIAQDGTLFTGRDPATGEQDNVRGAHFCGRNTGTMGVCLLGTYTNTAPTEATLGTLKGLLSWKLLKEGLDVYTENTHALGEFEAVIGHRDGCATECPGQQTYDLLLDLRLDVSTTLSDCLNPLPDEEEPPLLTIYPTIIREGMVHYRLAEGEEAPRQAIAIDMMGRQHPLQRGRYTQEAVSWGVSHLASGVYIINVEVGGTWQSQKVWVEYL